ncbi:YSIRK-type signal peptide-containing protein, partial [Limosilactobacillus vaginalis]|uniref:YSIRK-type signal peptide-containing protein n=1 Tax=Limosilactobacillus vaginalis TaxID=1633 RepID=UPI003734CB69
MKRHKFLETKRTPRYSLRKLNVGMVSVLLGVTIFGINFTDHSVKAATPVESVENPNSSPTGNLPQTSAVVLRTTGQTKGINAIGAVKVPDSQNDANKAIDDALNNKKSEINGAITIDQTTKDKLNQAATDAADKAKAAINQATTNNDVATEQTDTQKAASATGKVQQSSVSNNATANNSTEAATTSSTKAKQTTQTATKNSDNTKVSSNTTNKENSQPTDKTTNTQVVSNIDKTLASLLTKLLATTPTTDNSASGSSTLPKSDQTVTKVDPMMSDYLNRGGKNTWIDQTVAPSWFGSLGRDYAGEVETAIFGDTGIIKTNPHKCFFAGYADFSEGHHRIILFARGQDASDKNLYTYVVHTYTDNVQQQTVTPNAPAEIVYGGIGGSKYNLQVHNYNGESFSVVLKGFKYDSQGGHGLTPIFDQGILNPKYKDKTEKELDGENGINYKEHIGSWDSVIPQETTTSVRYVDLETGKDIAQPLMVTGYRYQGVKINGDAPKIDGYTLVSGPKTLGLSYENGIIAPYKVGQTYTQYITDDVYVKQTVIDTNGTVRATAYYKGQPLGASASKILGHDDNNDSMSFTAGGQSYTYNNRINDVDAAMVYYYQKVGEEGKSQLRVHYIDVTKDTDDSQYAPGDGVPATDPISGQEMNPVTYTGNIRHTYDYATSAKAPEGYVLVGTSPNLKGTFSRSDHDAYIYVKIDRHGAKATIENLTHLNNAQKQAAEAAIDQATDLNTMNQAISTATTLDGDMGKLSDLTADLTNTNNYKYASDTPKSTVATDCTEADVLLDKTAGQNADDATVLKLIDQINTHKSSLDGDTNLSAAETTISGLTHLNNAQRSAANQAVTNASDLTGLKTAVGNAQSVNSAMSDLQTAVNQANEAKTTNNYLQASADEKDNLNSAVQNAQAVLAATGANDSANQVKALTKSVNDAVDALDGDSNLANTKQQADQNIEQLTNLSADQKKAAKDKITT